MGRGDFLCPKGTVEGLGPPCITAHTRGWRCAEGRGVCLCVHLHMGRGSGKGVINPSKKNFVPTGYTIYQCLGQCTSSGLGSNENCG